MNRRVPVLHRLAVASYSRRWRDQHADEVLGHLTMEADERGRPRASTGSLLDLLGHGVVERHDRALSWVPLSVRGHLAALSGTILLALATVLLITDRQSWGVASPLLALAPICAVVVWLGRGHLARLLGLIASGVGVMVLGVVMLTGYPSPRLLVIGLILALACAATSSTVRRVPRWSAGSVVVVTAAVAGASLAGWIPAPDQNLALTYFTGVALAVWGSASAAQLIMAVVRREPSRILAAGLCGVVILLFHTLALDITGGRIEATVTATAVIGLVAATVVLARVLHRRAPYAEESTGQQ